MGATNSSVVDKHESNFREIFTTQMGESNVRYSPNPCTILGNGLNTIVYPGYHSGIRKAVAVKFIKNQYLRIEKNERANELKIWSELDQSVNIVRLYDSYHDPKNGLFIAMEKAERTFREQIEKSNPSRDDVITWLFQVSKAVEYLHGKGVIHRDIKPDNILMFLQDGNKTVAKLADFGVSKMISSAERSGTFSNANGTLLWMAPEALEHKSGLFKNTKMLDIFALGMTFYFGLSNGKHPFSISQNNHNLTDVMFEMTTNFTIPNSLSMDQLAANSLLRWMMQKEPKDRPQISDVLSNCLFWSWEKEHIFLIRVAICLSKQNCDHLESIKNKIDFGYKQHFDELYPRKKFNWISIAKDNGLDISELSSNWKSKRIANEYGVGDSVTKFIKFFRDKYVHYHEMSSSGAIMFSDCDGGFCEEKYARKLTSICPGLTEVLYQILSSNANRESLLPLSKIYFPWKLQQINNGQQIADPVSMNTTTIEENYGNSAEEPSLPSKITVQFKRRGLMHMSGGTGTFKWID